MKKIRWSPDAADDFIRIIEHIRKDNDAAAQRVVQTALQQIEGLKQFRNSGGLVELVEHASYRFRLFRLS